MAFWEISNTTSTYITSVLALLLGYRIVSSLLGFGSEKWSPKGQHCYVTGGNQGLGLSVAERLTRMGAHVSIVARDETKLASALESLEKNRTDPSQILKAYSFSLASAKDAAAAIDAASAAHDGKCPDAFFLCAGKSRPLFFLEMDEEELTTGMSNAYWLGAWTAWAAAKKMVKQGVKGRICFTGSTVAFMSYVGYASYSPGKYALRGLADCLRNELMLYGITVQIFFPNTMLTPGFEEELKIRPAITAKMEEGDQPSTPDESAKAMVDGVRDGHAQITGDFLTSLLRASTRGSTPRASFWWDWILDNIAFIGVPIWRRATDGMVLAHAYEHAEYLKSKGWFERA